MELAQPLAVLNITLAPTHVVQVMSVDQQHFEAALLEYLVQRNPIDPGRFHRHSLHAALRQPVRQSLQVAGEGAELT